MNNSSLWNNPFINNLKETLSKEDQDRYKKIGEEMYSVNFVNAGKNLPDFMEDSLISVFESLKSGMHPSALSEDEIRLLEEVFGKSWYTIFNYVEEDLNDIVTLNPNLNVKLYDHYKR
jgi:hypothetical protein